MGHHRGPAPKIPLGEDHLSLDWGGNAPGWGAGAWTLLILASTYTHIWSAHIWLLKRRQSATPPDRLNATQTPHSPRCCAPERWEKPGWTGSPVTLGIFALSTIPLRDRLRDPGELLSAAGVELSAGVVCSRLCFSLLWGVLHTATHTCTLASGGRGPQRKRRLY